MGAEPSPSEQARYFSAAELRDAWAILSAAERLDSFELLARDEADDFFVSLARPDQGELLKALPLGEQRIWMRRLPPDDVADLIQAVPPEDRDHFLDLLDDSTKREVLALMHYAEDDAGGLMSPRFARVRPEMSVDEAISYLRKQAREKLETLYYVYVLDPAQRLLGVVSFRELFTARPNQQVSEVMRTDLVTARDDMDQEELAILFDRYKILAIPVLDEAGAIKGIVTFDDIVDVVREEATEDIQKFGGVEALDDPYLISPFWKMIRKRAGWLVVLFLGELFTATAMAHYESEIAKAVVLALFIPLIISSGGNSGSQASTLMVRSLALGEVKLGDWWRVMVRELASGLVLGLILASVGFLRISLWPSRLQIYGEHYMLVALAVGLSLIGVVLWGTLCGAMLPFILRRCGFDPASASAPFVATVVDVTGLVIYFSVANLVFGGVLL